MELMVAYFRINLLDRILDLALDDFAGFQGPKDAIIWRSNELLLDLTGCIDSTL